jgi:hypothetical protein
VWNVSDTDSQIRLLLNYLCAIFTHESVNSVGFKVSNCVMPFSLF